MKGSDLGSTLKRLEVPCLFLALTGWNTEVMGGGGMARPPGRRVLREAALDLREPFCFSFTILFLGFFPQSSLFSFIHNVFASWCWDEKFYRLKKNVHYRITFKDKSDYKVMKYFKQ